MSKTKTNMELVSSNCLSANKIKILFNLTNAIDESTNKPAYGKSKIMVNVFFEPSTRTSLSFESAMHRMGGKIITFNKDVSSMKKGESFEDTIRTLSTYGDILVLRHPEKGMVEKAAKIASIPVINAGDGNGDHPTQGLLDLYTIAMKHKTNSHTVKNILFIGDIINSRTVHSLITMIRTMNTANLIDPDTIICPSFDIHILPYTGCESIKSDDFTMHTTESIDLSQMDVIYCTRLQRERITDVEKLNMRTNIMIDNHFLQKCKKDCMIMHPLPRTEEINPEIDGDDRVYYFKQMENGVKIRMAVLNFYLNDGNIVPRAYTVNDNFLHPHS
jgi:aspartate carbamoyltransferase